MVFKNTFCHLSLGGPTFPSNKTFQLHVTNRQDPAQTAEFYNKMRPFFQPMQPSVSPRVKGEKLRSLRDFHACFVGVVSSEIDGIIP